MLHGIFAVVVLGLVGCEGILFRCKGSLQGIE
jgi:hypothetical protein